MQIGNIKARVGRFLDNTGDILVIHEVLPEKIRYTYILKKGCGPENETLTESLFSLYKYRPIDFKGYIERLK